MRGLLNIGVAPRRTRRRKRTHRFPASPASSPWSTFGLPLALPVPAAAAAAVASTTGDPGPDPPSTLKRLLIRRALFSGTLGAGPLRRELPEALRGRGEESPVVGGRGEVGSASADAASAAAGPAASRGASTSVAAGAAPCSPAPPLPPLSALRRLSADACLRAGRGGCGPGLRLPALVALPVLRTDAREPGRSSPLEVCAEPGTKSVAAEVGMASGWAVAGEVTAGAEAGDAEGEGEGDGEEKDEEGMCVSRVEGPTLGGGSTSGREAAGPTGTSGCQPSSH